MLWFFLHIKIDQIDRIENKVENIHNNLDKGDRLLRDIESLGGHIYNGMTKGKKENYIVHPDREVKWKTKRAEKLDIPILFKHTNDLCTYCVCVCVCVCVLLLLLWVREIFNSYSLPLSQ